MVKTETKQNVRIGYGLKGYDSFSEEWYELRGTYRTEALAERAAQERLKELNRTQPSDQSGGQAGIQDEVWIERPDGTKRRVFPNSRSDARIKIVEEKKVAFRDDLMERFFRAQEEKFAEAMYASEQERKRGGLTPEDVQLGMKVRMRDCDGEGFFGPAGSFPSVPKGTIGAIVSVLPKKESEEHIWYEVKWERGGFYAGREVFADVELWRLERVCPLKTVKR